MSTEKKTGEMGSQKVTCGVAMSLDGFVAGLNMTEEKPLGDIPEGILHKWMFNEPEKHKDEIASLTSAGAFIMGRKMYGPIGEKYDKTWKGWWGDNPPYHAPVFVLTHKPRDPIHMEGGTVFNFVTEGIEHALELARQAAGDKHVDISGGASVINQYLKAGLIDELWLHIVPITLGNGKRLFEKVEDLHMKPLSYGGTELVTHIKYEIIK